MPSIMPQLLLLPLPPPLQVLLVEDNPGDVRLTREALREAGTRLDLHVVSNGAEALAFLGHEKNNIAAPRPDLILLDLYLPKMDGRSVLAHIKGNDELKTIPTAILTGSGSESDAVKSYQLQADYYFRKPHLWSEFKALVKGIVGFWLKVGSFQPLNETHQEDSAPRCLLFPASIESPVTEFSAFPIVTPLGISWPDPSALASLRMLKRISGEKVGVQLASVGKQREYCAGCEHPKSHHQNARCTGMVRQETRVFLQCGCEKFLPANTDPNQAAAE